MENKSELQSRTKYLRKTLIVMWNSALREKFNFYFQGVFCHNLFHNILRLFDVLTNFRDDVGDAGLLLINIVYKSCLTIRRTT